MLFKHVSPLVLLLSRQAGVPVRSPTEEESQPEKVQEFTAFCEGEKLLIQTLHFRERMRGCKKGGGSGDGVGLLILIHRVYLTLLTKGFQECQPIHFTQDPWSPRHRLKIVFLINLLS